MYSLRIGFRSRFGQGLGQTLQYKLSITFKLLSLQM